MEPSGLLAFLRRYRLAVQASVSAVNAPQAAVVGYAVTDLFEIVFDMLDSSRKGQNLRRNNQIALVIGGLMDGEERTVQYEGDRRRTVGRRTQSPEAGVLRGLARWAQPT